MSTPEEKAKRRRRFAQKAKAARQFELRVRQARVAGEKPRRKNWL